MRLLVLGAGAVGGYFGGRLAQSCVGDEIAFLVRPHRKAQLLRDGLVIESSFNGDMQLPVRALMADELRPGWDVILLACKAYHLAGAIAAVHPAVHDKCAILPLLNGMSHMDALTSAFGPERVLGGLAGIQATLTGEGVIRQLAPGEYVKFGELNGEMSKRVTDLKARFDRASVDAQASADIQGAMWAKLVFLGTLAAATVLMRANLGEIASAPGGAEWLERLLDSNAAIAAAQGHPVAPADLATFRAFFRSSPQAAASMLRDLEAGQQIEGDHILGFLLDAARRAGLPSELHEAAFIHARAYAARRDAGRLPTHPGDPS